MLTSSKGSDCFHETKMGSIWVQLTHRFDFSYFQDCFDWHKAENKISHKEYSTFPDEKMGMFHRDGRQFHIPSKTNSNFELNERG